MTEYHVRQFDGPPYTCDGRNCAAASGAMAVAFGSGGKTRPTADAFRASSGVSCVPGVDTNSGGLAISHVRDTAARYGVTVDYGPPGTLTRWTLEQMRVRIAGDFGAIVLGDYDAVIAPVRAPGSTFRGDHSIFVHDYRASDRTVCWHDPLRTSQVRATYSQLAAYWQKSGSPVRGLAGFVRIKPALPDTSTGADVPGLATTPRSPLVAGVARIPAGTEVINVETRDRPKFQSEGVRQAVGIFVRDYGSVPGYLIDYGGATCWVDAASVDFTPNTTAKSVTYAVTVGGKSAGSVTLP